MEEKMKKVLLCALIILIFAGSVFAAGGRDGPETRPRVGVVLGAMTNKFHTEMRQVVDAAVLHHPDINWTIRNATDANDQINMLTVLANENFDAMIIMPMDGNIVVPIAEQIYFSGTPTVILNRRINSTNYTAFVTGDNVGGGANAGRLIAERLGGRGNVAVLRMIPGTPIDMDRYAGFMSVINNFPNIRIVVEADAGTNRETGLAAMTNVLPGYPNIDAVFSMDDEVALGALTAINNAGRTDIRYITGFGGTRPVFEIFRDQAAGRPHSRTPLYVASMSYFPSFGYDAVEKVVRILRGIPTPKDTIIASQAVGSWNVEAFWADTY
jgi:ribose transport system substrate-binding protein